MKNATAYILAFALGAMAAHAIPVRASDHDIAYELRAIRRVLQRCAR